MVELVALLKAIADGTRLRILRLLLAEPALNVGELTAILGLAQSSVSRQLAELRRAGLVRERRESGFAYHELAEGERLGLVRSLAGELEGEGDAEGDLARLEEVRRSRRERGEGSGRVIEPGRSWVAWARALRRLMPPLVVADFGCGEGALTAEIAAWARRVIAIERDPGRLDRARRRIERAGLRNVEFLHQDLEDLTLADRTVDLVVASHVLHHVADPAAVLYQAARVLMPGGRLLVLELAPHREEWVRDKLGHRWLGFPAAELEASLTRAGLIEVEVERTPTSAAPQPFRILVAAARRPRQAEGDRVGRPVGSDGELPSGSRVTGSERQEVGNG